MRGNRTVLSNGTAEKPAVPTLVDLLANGELTCSAAQVARWLNVSKPTVIAAAKRGELPGKCIGAKRQWRFSTLALARDWGVEVPEGVAS
jgi:hypothetical protein